MPSLTAFITGNIDGLKSSLIVAQSLTAQTGSAMSKSIGASLGKLDKPLFNFGIEGKSGAMRETLVLMREIGRGNWSRVPGSFSILVNQLGILPKLLSPIFLIPIAVAAVFVGAWYALRKFSDSLVGLKLPDFNPEYIAKHLQKANQIVESQKEINKEIEKSIALYNGAAAAAERVSKSTKEDFDRKRKSNEYEEKAALTGAGSEEEKQKIRKKFSDQRLAINDQERDAQISNQRAAEAALKKEMQDKKKQADELGAALPSKAQDENNLRKRKADADAAQKELDILTAAKEKDRQDRESAGGMIDLPTAKARDKARDDKIADAKAVIKASHDFEDTAAANEDKRKRKEELIKEAGEAGKAMVKAGIEGDELAKKKSQEGVDDRALERSKLDAENANKISRHLPEVNALQRIGGSYSSIHDISMLDVSKKSEQHLAQVVKLLGIKANEAKSTTGVRY